MAESAHNIIFILKEMPPFIIYAFPLLLPDMCLNFGGRLLVLLLLLAHVFPCQEATDLGLDFCGGPILWRCTDLLSMAVAAHRVPSSTK